MCAEFILIHIKEEVDSAESLSRVRQQVFVL